MSTSRRTFRGRFVQLVPGRRPAAQTLGEECLVLRRTLHDERGEAHALILLGQVAADPGELQKAQPGLDRALTTYKTAAELGRLAEQLLTVVLPPARLLLCPSCGLGRRIVELALARVTAMVAAADRSEVDDPALRCLLW